MEHELDTALSIEALADAINRLAESQQRIMIGLEKIADAIIEYTYNPIKEGK